MYDREENTNIIYTQLKRTSPREILSPTPYLKYDTIMIQQNKYNNVAYLILNLIRTSCKALYQFSDIANMIRSSNIHKSNVCYISNKVSFLLLRIYRHFFGISKFSHTLFF